MQDQLFSTTSRWTAACFR